MTHTMNVPYKNDKLFHKRLKVLENTGVVLAIATFNNL